MSSIPESPARVEYTVQFSRGPKGRRRAREGAEEVAPSRAASAARLQKITRLLVLGHHFERLVREDKVKDYAEIARLTGLTRARVTQIVNLTLLAPEVQEAILSLPPVSRGRDAMTERELRRLIASVMWSTNPDGNLLGS